MAKNKTVLRGGYRLVFDRLGGALAVSFRWTSHSRIFRLQVRFRLTRSTCQIGLAPLFTGLSQDVRALPRFGPLIPTLKFPPYKQPSDQDQRIESGLDDAITTPYSHTFNVFAWS